MAKKRASSRKKSASRTATRSVGARPAAPSTKKKPTARKEPTRGGAGAQPAAPSKKRASAKVSFTFELQAVEGYRGAVLVLPPEVHAALGGDRARIAIAGTADGHAFRTSAAPMGGCHIVVFNRAMREATGKGAGDRVEFVLWRDTAPRTVSVPDDLARALAAAPRAAAAFEAFSYTHRKEYVAWIEEARRPETRARRVTQTIERLAAGKPQR